MWKFLRFRHKQIKPISKKEFQKFFLIQLISTLSFVAIIYALYSLSLINFQESVFILLIGVLGYSFILPDLISERLQDLYPDQDVSGIAIAGLVINPFCNLLILYYCFTRESQNGVPWLKPIFTKKRFALCLYGFMSFQAVLFGLVSGSERFYPLQVWINNPSTHKIAYVAVQARLVFEVKKEVVGKGNVPKAFETIQRRLPFDSTGHILSIAVIATDAFKRKKLMQERNPAASEEAFFQLMDGLLHQERIYDSNRLAGKHLNPLHLLSPANLVELSLLLLVEESIHANYKKTIKKKMSGILKSVRDQSIKKKYSADYLNQLSYYQGEINKF